ncbi:hypothetical protein Tco_0057417 [Tanacetum coccineum]
MAEETPSTIPLCTPKEEPNGSDPKEPPVDVNISVPASDDHILDHSLENTSGDLVMQFVVQIFGTKQHRVLNLLLKRKEINPTSAYNNDDRLVIESWRSDSEGSHEEAIRQAPKEAALQAKPSKKSRFAIENIKDLSKQRPASNDDFC